MNDFFIFLNEHYLELGKLIVDHISMSLISVLIAVLVGVPLGILMSNVKGSDKPILGFANVMQAIPSLAVLGLLVPLLGIGRPPAILMVVLYSLLPILKNIYTGLKSVNVSTIEAAKGIGMKPSQVLFKVKMPIALPMIMSGIRISAVNAIGLMTIAAYIGAGGLGNYVISGIQTNNVNLMLAGALPACILALMMDFIMSKIERALVPISYTMSINELTPKNIRRQKLKNKIVIVLVSVGLVSLLGSIIVPYFKKVDNTIVIASKPEVEGVIIGNIIALLIDEKTDLEVKTKFGLGSTKIIYEALKKGEIDIYPEYSGSVYSGIFNLTYQSGTSPEQVSLDVKKMMIKDNIEYGDFYGFNNRYTLGLLSSDAKKYQLKTISDLEKVSGELSLACDSEFLHRADGIPALQKVYPNLKFKEYRQFSGVLMYDALVNKHVDVMTPFTTDALLNKYDITILNDDKLALSNYTMATAYNMDSLLRFPHVKNLLAQLQGNISDVEMSKLNYEVVVNQRNAIDVAREFLKDKKLID
ncbi:MAG: glycine betaine ABC transporter substrate-binding protein [Erysipelotrichaceae bacterium]